jgi:hypothetical protein
MSNVMNLPELTTMVNATKRVYVKKSPGRVKRELSVSKLLPYRYKKKGSSIIESLGPVIRNAVRHRQTCNCRTASLMNMSCINPIMPV